MSEGEKIVYGLGLMLIISISLTYCFWEWLNEGQNSSTVRNVGLLIGAPIAIVLAVWRSRVAERQADTSQMQADIAQSSLLNERYQKCSEMLGSKALAVRLGGIDALVRLAEASTDKFAVRAIKLFCAFTQFPINDADLTQPIPDNEGLCVLIRPDVLASVQAISALNRLLDDADRPHLDLSGAIMNGAYLIDAVLPNANLTLAQLNNAHLEGADLSYMVTHRLDVYIGAEDVNGERFNPNEHRTELHNAHLEGAILSNANLSLADLTGAHLEGAHLEDAIMP